MKLGRASICPAMVLVALLAAGAGTEELRNEKVVVVEDRLEPGEARSLRGELPGVVVYLEDGKLEITPSGGKLRTAGIRRGEAVFEPPQARTLKNTGSSAVRLVQVDFPGPGAPETWGTAGLPPNYRLIFENRYARVYDIRVPAGTSEPRHTHKDRVVICLSGADLVHEMPDGSREPSTLATGEIAWRRGATHIGHNIGKTDLWVIAVEPK